MELDRTPFNRAGMKHNAVDGLFTKSSELAMKLMGIIESHRGGSTTELLAD
jgi:hypothetical protein